MSARAQGACCDGCSVPWFLWIFAILPLLRKWSRASPFIYLMQMQQGDPPKSHAGLWLLATVILPMGYLLSAPVVYVAGDKLGVHEQPLAVYCAPYDWLEQNSPLWKPLTEYWMLWMRVGYG